MTAAAVYGDIGFLGGPSPQLTTPVKPVAAASLMSSPLHSTTQTQTATRALSISVLPGQSLTVRVAPVGVLGGLNADVHARIHGAAYLINTDVDLTVAPAPYDLELGVQVDSRGGLVAISEIDYQVEATPANDLTDRTGNGYHASIASVKRVEGVTLRALAFEGEPDHVEIPDLGWASGDDRGVSLWARMVGDGPLCQLSPNASLEVVSGILNLRYLGVDYPLHTASLGGTEWHHVLVWVDTSGTVSTWVDSDSPVETALSVSFGATWEMYLARSGSRYWNGEVDEILLLNTLPSPAEIARLKGAQNPLPGSVYADRLHGQPVYPVVTGGVYPIDPVRGQTVVTWDGTTARLEAYIDGAWRQI